MTCLGNLTSDTIMYTPLGRFARSGSTVPTRGGKPLVLFVGSLFDAPSAAERWALVKALSRFGTFRGLTSTASNPAVRGQAKIPVPTYNLSRASYSSPYLTFAHVDIQDFWAKPLQKLSPADDALVRRFQFLPVLIVGDYFLSRPMVAPQEFVDRRKRPYTFQHVRSALARNYNKLNLLGQLTSDINAETNIQVALICHLDGGRPASICGTPTVRALVKRLR